jgi:phage baseplate assembly protein gpV
MTTIVNTLQQIIRHELQSLRIAELGVVEAIYPHSDGGDNDNYGCDVRLKNSDLLLKRVPVASGHIGTVAIPNIGDLVLLTFDKGDINQPIIIGRLYNDEDRPPLNTNDEVIFRLPLAKADDETIMAAIRNTGSGSEPREMIMEMPPQITVRISDGAVRATAGDTEMVLDQPHNSGGKVTVVTGRSKITMNQDGDITVEAAGAMTIKATNDLTLEGMNVKIKGQMKATMEAGTEAEVKGGISAKLEGSASATVKASAITEISGGLVKIN